MELWLPELGHVLFSLTLGTSCLAPGRDDRRLWLKLIAGYVATLLLYGVLVHAAGWRPMSAAFLCILAPYLYLFFPLSRFRDLRFLLTVLLIGNLSIVLQFLTNSLLFLLDGTEPMLLWRGLLFVGIVGLAVAMVCFCRPLVNRYLTLLQQLPRGWGLMTASSAMIEIALIYLSIYPAPLSARPEYFPVYAMFILTVLSYYAVLISIMFKMRRIYDQDRVIRHKEGWDNIAYMDALTGQPNRVAYMEKLARLGQEPDACASTAIVVLDLNDLRQVNMSEGHEAGDSLIRDAAALLSITFSGRKAEVYRIGGDEFAVIDQDATEAMIIRKLSYLDTVCLQNRRFSMAAGFSMVDPAEADAPRCAFLRADRLMAQDKARRKAAD